MYDSGPADDRLLIFCTRKNLQVLARTANWYADGTFKTVPHFFHQLYTLHVYVNFIKTIMEQIKQFVQQMKDRDVTIQEQKTIKKSVADSNMVLSAIQLIDQNVYNLNKSKTKFISVGMNCANHFCPSVKIFATYKQEIVFTEEEWVWFLELREKIHRCFQSTEAICEPIKVGTKTIIFEIIDQKKILKIVGAENEEVYLGRESLWEIWKLAVLINYRLNQIVLKEFSNFYDTVINAVFDLPGDAKTNISNVLDQFLSKTDVVCCMLEVVTFYPEKVVFDVELEKLQTVKMWMAYAEQTWTKAVDFQTAVQRLVQEFSALEFDAEHEAVYGFTSPELCATLAEKYQNGQKFLETDANKILQRFDCIFSIDYCKELANKYMIGQDICNLFLKGEYCIKCVEMQLNIIDLYCFKVC
ncbi:hypothetical protein RN001_016134 [Aquatica leii]|uniref:Uncharacterized protein n=1 Tax=Aquatica leii TaxID=1421715 RepID=A0AAN7SN14_9COLE|nr:hypothetical protein RN001_016134 [Aquatica leii]